MPGSVGFHIMASEPRILATRRERKVKIKNTITHELSMYILLETLTQKTNYKTAFIVVMFVHYRGGVHFMASDS